MAPEGQLADKISSITIKDVLSAPTSNIVAKEASCQIEIHTQPGHGSEVVAGLERLGNEIKRIVIADDGVGADCQLRPLEGHNPEKGIIRYQLNVAGRAAHSGMEWHKGIPATLAQSLEIMGIYRLAGKLPPALEATLTRQPSAEQLSAFQKGSTTVNISAVESSGNNAITFEVEMRATSRANSYERANVVLENLIRGPQVPAVEAQITDEIISRPYPPANRPEGTAILLDVAKGAGEGLWEEREVVVAPKAGGSDLNKLPSDLPVAALDSFGVPGDGDHSNRARILLPEAQKAYFLLKRTITGLSERVDEIRAARDRDLERIR